MVFRGYIDEFLDESYFEMQPILLILRGRGDSRVFSAFWRQLRGVNFPVNRAFIEFCFLENFLQFLGIL